MDFLQSFTEDIYSFWQFASGLHDLEAEWNDFSGEKEINDLLFVRLKQNQSTPQIRYTTRSHATMDMLKHMSYA